MAVSASAASETMLAPAVTDAGAAAPTDPLLPVGALPRAALAREDRPSPIARVFAPLRLLHRAARYRWKLNPGEIRAMLDHLARAKPGGKVALDIGAHKGGYAFWMSRAVRSSGAGLREGGALSADGRVFAFEPQLRVAVPAAASFRAARVRNVTYYHAAVSETSGVATLSFLGGSTHGATLDGLDRKDDVHAAQVRTVSVDDFVRCVGDDGSVAEDAAPALTGTCSIVKRGLGRVDFLKIDVEGHEMSVLRGARATIERFRPALLVEAESRLHDGGPDPVTEVANFLAPFGYDGFFFRRAQRLPLSDFRHEEHQKYGAGFYSNNFFFAPAAPKR